MPQDYAAASPVELDTTLRSEKGKSVRFGDELVREFSSADSAYGAHEPPFNKPAFGRAYGGGSSGQYKAECDPRFPQFPDDDEIVDEIPPPALSGSGFEGRLDEGRIGGGFEGRLSELPGFQQAESTDPDVPPVHRVFQLWQEGDISREEFMQALGDDVPPAVRKLLDSDPQVSFPKFVKAFGKVNSFDNFRAGGKTKYKDSAASIINDNSGGAKPSKIVMEDTSFRRVRSDINAADREKLTANKQMLVAKGASQGLPVRRRNELSNDNPMVRGMPSNEAFISATTSSSSVGNVKKLEIDPSDKEQEALLQSAVRMFLSGEIDKHELIEYVLGIAGDGVKLQIKTLVEQHEVNGPFNFMTMMQRMRRIVNK